MGGTGWPLKMVSGCFSSQESSDALELLAASVVVAAASDRSVRNIDRIAAVERVANEERPPCADREE